MKLLLHSSHLSVQVLLSPLLANADAVVAFVTSMFCSHVDCQIIILPDLLLIRKIHRPWSPIDVALSPTDYHQAPSTSSRSELVGARGCE